MAEGGKIYILEGDAPGTPASGRIVVYVKTDSIVYMKDDTGTETPFVGQTLTDNNSITLQNPNNSEDTPFFFTEVAITVTKLAAVVVGSATPSVTYTIRHDPDRSATGNEVVTGGTVVTSETTGDIVTSFNDETIPANSFVWLETTAQSGTVDYLSVTLFSTKD